MWSGVLAAHNAASESSNRRLLLYFSPAPGLKILLTRLHSLTDYHQAAAGTTHAQHSVGGRWRINGAVTW